MGKDESATSKVPQFVEKTGENLLVPVAKEIGTTFADIWNIIFGNISLYAEKAKYYRAQKLEQFKALTEKKFQAIPDNQKQLPDLQVIGGTLEDSRFCFDKDELRDLFATLIASSMDSEKADKIHPAFSGFIRRMTPADARVLMRFKASNRFPIVNYRFAMNHGHSVFEENVMDPKATPEEMRSVSRSLEVLQSFRLIRLDYESYLTADGIYSEFDQHHMITAKDAVLPMVKATNPLIKDINYQKGIAELTSLGKQFLEVCT